MSDLISRSALIKVLKDRATNEAIMGYMTAYDVINSIIDEVEEQPTAYSVDKVVAELEKESKRVFLSMTQMLFLNYRIRYSTKDSSLAV